MPATHPLPSNVRIDKVMLVMRAVPMAVTTSVPSEAQLGKLRAPALPPGPDDPPNKTH